MSRPREFFLLWLRTACAMLTYYRSEIDRINVYPMPDGDTGKNMLRTMMAILAAIEALPENASLNDCIEAILQAGGAAEGNSGSFLANWIRGFCTNLPADLTELGLDNVVALARAFQAGYDQALSSTRQPKAGTLLSVMGAFALASADSKISFNQLIDIGWLTVDDTPNHLPVLKDNHVVDSGAMGIAVIVEALYKSRVAQTDHQSRYQRISSFRPVAIVDEHLVTSSKYRFCCSVTATSTRTFEQEKLLDVLWRIGDSVVFGPVGSGADYQLHIHTNKPRRLYKLLWRRGLKITKFKQPTDMWSQAVERNRSLLAANLESDQVAIVTDGGAELTDAEREEFAVDVLALGVSTDGHTSAVATQAWVQAIEERLASGRDVIIITLSSGLSSTFEHAEQAAIYLSARYPERRIDCVDSLAGSRAQAWLAITARQMLRASYSQTAVVEHLLEIRQRIQIYIAIGDVEAMVRGGRMPKLAHKVLDGLNQVPIICLTSEGGLTLAGFAARRSVVRAMETRLRSVCRHQRDTVAIAALYTDSTAHAEALSTVMAQVIGQAAPVSPVGSVIGAHLGSSDDTVAFVVVGKLRKK